MKNNFKILFIYFLSTLFCAHLVAQKNIADSTSDSSQQVAEKYLIQQKEQQRIDSIVTTQLQKELGEVTTDSKRRKALEDSLHQLSRKEIVRKEEQLKKIDELKRNAKGYPVRLVSDTLFYLFTRIGSFSAAERANAITERIGKLYDDAFFNADSMKVIKNEVTWDIVYNNDVILMSVTDLDALWYNKTADKLAGEYLKKIKNEILKQKQANSLVSWLMRLGHILLIIFGIWLIIYGVNRLFKYLSAKLIDKKEKYFRGFSFRKIKLLTAEQHYVFAMRINNFLRIVIILLAIYLALPLFFSVFPQTKPFATVMWRWIITPAKSVFNGVVNFLPNFFTIVIIYFATTYLIKLIKYFTIEIDKETIHINGFYKEWAWPTYHIAKFLIYAFMFVVIFPYLPGSKSSAFRGVSVFLGVLISLGSSSAISNMVAGLVITYMRPFKIGDRVKIGEVVGDVIEKTMLITRIRTIKNEDITVPNSTVLNTHTINYSANCVDTGLIIHTTVTIGYGVPWKDMHQALIDAALKTTFVLPQPLPFVLQTSLDDFFVSYQVNAYTKEANRQANIYSELHQNIQDVCNERGIEIMSSHYNALRDGNTITIPESHLPRDHKNSSFNVKIKKEDDDK